MACSDVMKKAPCVGWNDASVKTIVMDIIGYTPLGVISGLARTAFAAYNLHNHRKDEGETHSVLECDKSKQLIGHIVRGVAEVFQAGLVLFLIDLVVTIGKAIKNHVGGMNSTVKNFPRGTYDATDANGRSTVAMPVAQPVYSQTQQDEGF